METNISNYYPAKKITQYSIKLGASRVRKRTVSVSECGTDRIIGRTLLKFMPAIGDYEDGSGPGFIGLLLERDPDRCLSREWLVVTIESGGFFGLLNGRWIDASAQFHKIQKPLICGNEIGKLIEGCVIVSMKLNKDALLLVLESASGVSHSLEFLRKDERLSRWPNSHAPLIAFKESGQMADYVILMEETGRITL